jgi:nucleotide-binding universal stress UspA family protein
MFNHIMVPLDGSELAECAVPHAVILAEAMGSKVTLFHSLERLQPSSVFAPVNPHEWQMRKTEAEQYLNTITEKLRHKIPDVDQVLVEGPAAERVIEFAHSSGVDCIVLSSHGRSGLTGWNISSVVQKIILRAYVSTLIVRAYSEDPFAGGYKKIMVALDCSNRAESALPIGILLARDIKSELVLAHVVKNPEMPRSLPPSSEDIALSEKMIERNHAAAEEYLKQLTFQLSSENVTPIVKLLTGQSVASTLNSLVKSEKIDLLILSAHGNQGGTTWPYGSIAVSFIAYGTTPLLVMQDIPHGAAKTTRAERAAKESFGH